MKYKAIIFDLFDTLVDNSPSVIQIEILRQMATAVSIPLDSFKRQWDANYEDRMKGTFKSYEKCISHICQNLGMPQLDFQIKQAANIYFNMAKNEASTTKDGAIEVLSYLKLNKYKTGLISNLSHPVMVLWDQTYLASLFDIKAFSCAEGLTKPDPRIFKLALEKLQSKPEDCLYIADGMNGELATAKKLGMDALMIRVTADSYQPLREEWSGPVITSLREIPAFIEKRE